MSEVLVLNESEPNASFAANFGSSKAQTQSVTCAYSVSPAKLSTSASLLYNVRVVLGRLHRQAHASTPTAWHIHLRRPSHHLSSAGGSKSWQLSTAATHLWEAKAHGRAFRVGCCCHLFHSIENRFRALEEPCQITKMLSIPLVELCIASYDLRPASCVWCAL